MDIVHRISINSQRDQEFSAKVYELNLDLIVSDLPGGDSQLLTFTMVESDKYWPEISKLISEKGAVNIVETIFTDEEVRNSEWLRLVSTFEQGYPQPKDNWPYKQSSRELLCTKCAIYRQTGSMRFAKEPYLGKKSFMTLIWENETFCVPEVVQGLEQIQAKGYEQWNAVIHKTGQVVERVKQLYIPNVTSPGMIVEDELKRVKCPVCGTIKYYPHVRGKMQIERGALVPDTDFMSTNEWFGSGNLAWREILVSNRVASMILDKGWQGLRFKVVDIV